MSTFIKRRSRLAAAALLCVGATARAQSADQIGAYLAIQRTQMGLVPVPAETGFSGRYTHVGSGPVNAATSLFAVTGILAGDNMSISATLGGYDVDCPVSDCGAKVMGGASASYNAYATPMGGNAGSTIFSIAVDGEVSVAEKLLATSWWGFRFGVPLKLDVVPTTDGLRISPYLVPSIAYGHAHEDFGVIEHTWSDYRGMIGGGVQVSSSGGRLRGAIGFTRIVITDGRTGFGGSLSVRP